VVGAEYDDDGRPADLRTVVQHVAATVSAVRSAAVSASCSLFRSYAMGGGV
jgi:hypothetical protein